MAPQTFGSIWAAMIAFGDRTPAEWQSFDQIR